MKKCPYSQKREAILAEAISPVAAELRLLDASDLISLLRFECHGSLVDLVASAAELYFLPGTVNFGLGGDFRLDWDSQPSITLDLEIRPQGVTIYAQLTLQAEEAGVSINHIAFENPCEDPEANTAFLVESLRDASFIKDFKCLTGPVFREDRAA
ncbi:hypothetical protein NOF55_03140 [Rhizobiaceae bacterium BDR2-2]|uniref:Uncharacterized protein n=1 Tax=Ectorhizobium quercum TaxID=2965071 RepID=A0AAE3MXI6_9HYPH|nr:hypothetical protein [Ectorhizobium quercum]MCX8996091.1 hypothetical protein [Ectorhizobium quercum]